MLTGTSPAMIAVVVVICVAAAAGGIGAVVYLRGSREVTPIV